MVTNDALRMTVVKVFDACARTIYIAKILWAKKIMYRQKISVWAVCSRISYYRPRIIRIQLSDNPYLSDITNTIS
jgi:hypothetical protein